MHSSKTKEEEEEWSFSLSAHLMGREKRRHDIQHNDIQHIGIQHNHLVNCYAECRYAGSRGG